MTPFPIPLLTLLLLLTVSPTMAQDGKFYGAKITDYPDWFKESFLDLREDISEAAVAKRRVMIFFHQEGCPYCNLMVERNLAQRDISERMQQHLDVIALDMWGDREVIDLQGKTTTEKAFAEALRVQFTPTLLAFDEAGKVVLRLNGYLPPERFILALDYLIGQHEKTESYRNYIAKRLPAKSAGKLNPEPFFNLQTTDLDAPRDRPFALFFEQRHCPDCDRTHREVFSQPAVREQVERFDAVQLDMWSRETITRPDGKRSSVRDWARELGVSYAPSVLLFSPDGQEIIRTEAYFKTFHTASIFDYVASGGYRDEPSFQRYLSRRADQIRESGKNVNIWK